MAKKIIQINLDYNFQIIGIITSLNDYKLAWLINNQLNTKFSVNNFFTSVYNNSFYSITSPSKILFTEHNKQNKLFFKELEKFNFIFKIYNNTKLANQIILELKKNKDINFISLIDTKRLTKKTSKMLAQLDFNDNFYE